MASGMGSYINAGFKTKTSSLLQRYVQIFLSPKTASSVMNPAISEFPLIYLPFTYTIRYKHLMK